MFDLFRLPKWGKQHLAVLGYTVYQSEYDAVVAERDALQRELDLQGQENGKLWAQLREAKEDAAVWRSKYEDLQTELAAANQYKDDIIHTGIQMELKKPAKPARRAKTKEVPQ